MRGPRERWETFYPEAEMQTQSHLANAAELRKERMVRELEHQGLSWDKMSASACLAILVAGTKITALPTAVAPPQPRVAPGLDQVPA